MPGGRPPLYTSEEELSDLIDAYWDEIAEKQEPPTMSGLALHLGMSTESLRRYGAKDEFCGTVKKARQRVESYLEKSLYNSSCTGVIFNLKNNFGWKDQRDYVQDVQVSDMSSEAIDQRFEELLQEFAAGQEESGNSTT